VRNFRKKGDHADATPDDGRAWLQQPALAVRAPAADLQNSESGWRCWTAGMRCCMGAGMTRSENHPRRRGDLQSV
jgi:hypothetical protein